MAAGESAEAEAKRARGAASHLERKARYAAKVADDYAKGAAGEQLVAAELEKLTASGWRILHDRRAPDGGNIDHLAIGPPGVAVVDAKNWSSAVTINAERRLVSSKYDHTEEVDRLNALVDHVRGLANRDGSPLSVRGYMVLTGDLDRDRAASDLGDIRIVGLTKVNGRLTKTRGDLSPELVDAIAGTLDAALPSATAVDRGEAPKPEPLGNDAPGVPSPLFERAHRFFYLRSWKKAGHHRLYLSDRDGTSLGWTDVNTGATTIDCQGDDRKLAEALLAAADPTGVKLAPGDLPKVATRLWGGRLLSRVARFHTSVLVGQEWRAYGKHRLYGTLIDPSVNRFDLGWIDLKTGEVHPTIDGDIAKDRGPADRYLAYLQHHLPER